MSESESSDPNIESVLFAGGEQYTAHVPTRFLVYVNASEWLDREQLAQRYDERSAELCERLPERVAQERLNTHPTVIRECVRGRVAGIATKAVCEGQLVRAFLSADDMQHAFGFLECWLCAASYFVPESSLEGVFAMLPKLAGHMRVNRNLENLSTARAVQLQNEKLVTKTKDYGCQLYMECCRAVFKAREQMPKGVYIVEDDDICWERVDRVEESASAKFKGLTDGSLIRAGCVGREANVGQ
jgi:hypothetical protein